MNDSSELRSDGKPPILAFKRSRVALACQRCKKRKQKCTGEHPICESCTQANAACVYEPTLRPRYPGGRRLYIDALEQHVAYLERMAPEHSQDHLNQMFPHSPRPRQARSRNVEHVASVDESPSEEDSSIVDGVAYLSLCVSGTSKPSEQLYIGSSSGSTIARLIQSSIYRGKPAHRDYISTTPSVSTDSTKTPKSTSQMVNCPTRAQAQILFSVFFDRLHSRCPILDRSLYERAFEHQYDQTGLPVIQRCVIHLIYAITARFMQLTSAPIGLDPEAHFNAAIDLLEAVLEQRSTGTAQVLILLAMYGQRSPSGSGDWSQTRYAMTRCIELGLHRKVTLNTPHVGPREAEMRKRIFWGCYCLDRVSSVVLGRPFAIEDRDINVQLPSDSSEFNDLTMQSSLSDRDLSTWPSSRSFIHVTKLRRLQSRIYRTVFRVDITSAHAPPGYRDKLEKKLTRFRSELEEWWASVPTLLPEAHDPSPPYQPGRTYHDPKEFYNLHYHKTILSLYTAFLPSLPTTDSRFITAATSAADVCSTYKSLNQQGILSFTMVALHSCFIAGLTLAYCMWRDRTLFSYHLLESTRACSHCLTIFAEKWPGAVKYRDAFEELSGIVLRTVMGGDGGRGSVQSKQVKQHTANAQTGEKQSHQQQQQQQPSSSSSFGHARTASRVQDQVKSSFKQFGDESIIVERELSPQPPMAPTDEMDEVYWGEAPFTPVSSQFIGGAMKDMLREVNDYGPGVGGGWQGLRMFNEMVQSDIEMRGYRPDENGGDWSNTSAHFAGHIDTSGSGYQNQKRGGDFGTPTWLGGGTNGGFEPRGNHSAHPVGMRAADSSGNNYTHDAGLGSGSWDYELFGRNL